MSTEEEPLPLRAQFPRPVRSPSTMNVYQRGMANYEAYCEHHHQVPHPADVHVVRRWIDYLYTLPGKGGRPTSPETVRKYLAAVKLKQLQMRDQDPTWPILDSELLRDQVRAYEWRYTQEGHRPPEMERFTAGHLLAVLGWLDRETYRGRRDAAVISLLYGATAKRDEVARLRMEDVALVDGGVRVRFASSGRGAFIEPNPDNSQRCPVQAVTEYLCDLHAHGLHTGPVVARMLKEDRWPDEWVSVSPMTVTALVRRVCAAAGLGHHTAESVRAGSAKDVAAATEGDLLAVADAGGWADPRAPRAHVDDRRMYGQVLGAVYRTAVPVPTQQHQPGPPGETCGNE